MEGLTGCTSEEDLPTQVGQTFRALIVPRGSPGEEPALARVEIIGTDPKALDGTEGFWVEGVDGSDRHEVPGAEIGNFSEGLVADLSDATDGYYWKAYGTTTKVFPISEDLWRNLRDTSSDDEDPDDSPESLREQLDHEKQAALEEAQETGERVEIGRITTACDGSAPECDRDLLVDYATPEGEIESERIHLH